MEKPTHSSKPKGTLWVPSHLCGGCGALLAVVVSLAGLLKEVRAQVVTFIEEGHFYEGEMWVVTSRTEWAFAAGAALCIAFFVLDSSKLWRQLLLGVCSIVLIVGASMSLALWGVAMAPVTLLIAVTGSWLFAILYASQHEMPCEGGLMVQKAKHSLGGKLEVEGEQTIEADELETVEPMEEVVAECEPIGAAKVAVPMPKIGKGQKPLGKIVIKTKDKTNG